MKSILISIKPKWVAKILNGIKTLEIRKRFPKDYVGWVYIYCTKEEYLMDTDKGYFSTKNGLMEIGYYYKRMRNINGKVVARFWCDKVEEIKLNLALRYSTDSMKEEELLKRSCLTVDEIDNYLWSNICCGKSIHITKLEIFDKPKEISEFKRYINDSDCKKCAYGSRCPLYPCDKIPLTCAPQSWCYIENI